VSEVFPTEHYDLGKKANATESWKGGKETRPGSLLNPGRRRNKEGGKGRQAHTVSYHKESLRQTLTIWGKERGVYHSVPGGDEGVKEREEIKRRKVEIYFKPGPNGISGGGLNKI